MKENKKEITPIGVIQLLVAILRNVAYEINYRRISDFVNDFL